MKLSLLYEGSTGVLVRPHAYHPVTPQGAPLHVPMPKNPPKEKSEQDRKKYFKICNCKRKKCKHNKFSI